MKMLMVGAGATGGYFGGRLLEAGQDLTFLLREGRVAQLARDGLRIRSPHGDVTLPQPATVTTQTIAHPYELVIVSCKAYHLPQVIEDIAPAVGPDTAILPILNGLHQLDLLDQRFGAERVLGGFCFIVSTLDGEGVVQHMGKPHGLTFGERDGSRSARVERIARAFGGARFDAQLSEHILQEMWGKWIFLATLAGSTCLMRAPIGDIVAAPHGREIVLGVLEECRKAAQAYAFDLSAEGLERAQRSLTEPGSPMTASMLRDLQQGAPVEADHIIGDLLARGEAAGLKLPLLQVVYAHLKAYEARRRA